MSLLSGMGKLIDRKRGTTRDTRLTSNEKTAIAAAVGSVATIGIVYVITMLLSV